jgi:phospholipid transport system substrate-binding protein
MKRDIKALLYSGLLIAGLGLAAFQTAPAQAAVPAPIAVSGHPVLIKAAAPATDATGFIEKLGDEAIQQLAGTQIDDQSRRDRFVQLMDKYFKMDVVARFVLGRYWRSLSDQDLTHFADLLKHYLALNYASQFKGFDGEKFVVGDADENGKDTFVHSKVVRNDGGPPVKIVWRLRKFDGHYRIIDVSIEGLSMGITQRDEFASVIQKNGGNVGALTDLLKQKTGMK